MNRNQSRLHPEYSGVAMALWIWLALGVAAMLLIPHLRGNDPMFGWLPFWLVVAPLIDLAVLRRSWLAATSRTFLVRSRRRRQPRAASGYIVVASGRACGAVVTRHR